jgi:hypothetical protein
MMSDWLTPDPPHIKIVTCKQRNKMEKYDKAFLVLAHGRSIYHEKRINESTLCGCSCHSDAWSCERD